MDINCPVSLKILASHITVINPITYYVIYQLMSYTLVLFYAGQLNILWLENKGSVSFSCIARQLLVDLLQLYSSSMDFVTKFIKLILYSVANFFESKGEGIYNMELVRAKVNAFTT